MKIRHSMSILVMIKDSGGQKVMGIHPQQKPAKTPHPPLSRHDIPGLPSREDFSCRASVEAVQGVQCAPIPALSTLSQLGRAPRCGGSSLSLPSSIPALLRVDPAPGKRAASSSCSAFQCYHSDE